MAFCRDIASHEKNPDPGDEKFVSQDIPQVKNFGSFNLGIFPEFFRGFYFPILRFSRFPGFSNRDSNPRDFGIFRSSPK